MATPPGGTNVNVNVTVVVQQALAAFQRLQQAGSGAFSRLSASARSTRLEFTGLDRIISYMAAGSVLAAVTAFTRLSAEIQRTSLMMIALEGSTAKATQQMDRLITLTTKTPYSIGAVSDAFIKLKTSGIEPIIDKNGNGPLRNLLDAVAAFGGTEEQLHRASIALQQMAGKGVISMEELRQQLGEAVPTAIRLMAEGLGKTVPQLIAEISKGQVEFQKGFDALNRMFEEKYAGLGEKIKKVSLAGAFQGVRNEIEQLSVTLNRIGALDALTAGLHLAAAAIKAFHNSIAPLKGETRDYANATEAVTKALEDMSKWVEKNASEIAAFINALIGLAQIFAAFTNLIFTFLAQFPSDLVAGGLIGYIFFGRTLKAAVIFALLARFSDQVAGFINFVGKVIDAMPDDMAFYGLVGFLILGKKGVILGVVLATVKSAFSYVLEFFDKVTQKLAYIRGYLIGVTDNMKSLFTGGSMTDPTVRAKQEQATQATQNSRERTMMSDRTITGALKTEEAKSGRVTGQSLRDAAQQFRTEIKSITEARAALEKAMKPLNTPLGLNAAQEAQMTKAMQHMADMEERLTGLKLGNGAKIRKENEQYLKQGEQIVSNLREEAKLLAAKGDTAGAQQKLKVASDTEAAYAKMRATVEELAKAEDARSGARANAKAKRAAEQLARRLDAESDKIARYKSDLEKYGADLDEAYAKLFGADEMETARVQAINDFASFEDRLNDMAIAVENLKLNEEEETKILAELIFLQDKLNKARDQAITINQRLAQRKMDDETRGMLDEFDEEGRKDRERALSRGFSLFPGRDAEQRQLMDEWEDEVRGFEDRILDLRRKIEDEPASLMNKQREQWVAQFQERIQAADEYYTYMLSQERRLHEATQELWTQTGNIIRSSLEDAIYNLITGSGTAKEVILQMYQEITRAAIRYLMQVIMIKMIEAGLNMLMPGLGTGVTSFMGFGGGGSGGFSMGARGGMGAKNGATFKKFGAGGMFTNSIVRGPTNFNIGEMGEAGPEGIFPLANVGGKLGVHAKGGGDVYQVTIHAVDARSIRQLLMENSDAIIPAVVAQGRLNNSVGRTR